MNHSLRIIKVGGAELAEGPVLQRLIARLASLHATGPVALVHGGGPEIAALQRRLGLEPCYVEGLRVTDDACMDVAEMVLSGTVNKRVVAHLVSAGVAAIGLCGVDAGLFRATPLKHGDVDLGRVGTIQEVNTHLLDLLLSDGLLPVISPISLGNDGRALNVNADHAAMALARATQAKELVFVTDTPGVLQDGRVIPAIDHDLAERLILDGVITGGMVPKIRSALDALCAGVRRVRITNLDGLERDGGTCIGMAQQQQGELA